MKFARVRLSKHFFFFYIANDPCAFGLIRQPVQSRYRSGKQMAKEKE